MPVEKIVLINAVKIFVSIVLFFFIMKMLRLEHVTELRLLNFIFVFWGVNSAIKKNLTANGNSAYLSNLFLGFFTSFMSVILISLSLAIYLFYIDPSFIKVLEQSTLWGQTLSPPLMSFAIMIEGVASSMICTFIVMQYWKNKKSKVLSSNGV
ncbi:MAG: hypothetical protein KUG51_04180 [Urechidicola sp.]|nr:hypothetical protein [Urechidicola sp.]